MREAVLHAIFLDLHKAYDSLDKSRCLDILDGYVVSATLPAKGIWVSTLLLGIDLFTLV